MTHSRFPQRTVFHRTPGPATGASDDGLEGSYSAVIHTTPVDGLCQVVVPALDLQRYRTAFIPSIYTVSVGDVVLITFDEQKRPWVVSHAG